MRWTRGGTFVLNLYPELLFGDPKRVPKCLRIVPSWTENASRGRNGDAEEIQGDPEGRIVDYSKEFLENLEPARSTFEHLEPRSPPPLITFYRSS